MNTPTCQAIALALTPCTTDGDGLHLSIGQAHGSANADQAILPEFHLGAFADVLCVPGGRRAACWRLSNSHWLEMDGTRTEANAMWDRQGNPLPRNPLRDVRVRRAITQAIDETAIATRIMRGSAVAIGTAAIPGVNGYQRDLDVRLPYDVAASPRNGSNADACQASTRG